MSTEIDGFWTALELSGPDTNAITTATVNAIVIAAAHATGRLGAASNLR
jgi:hypothetical protein